MTTHGAMTGFQVPAGGSEHPSPAPSYHASLAHTPLPQQAHHSYGYQPTDMYGNERSLYLQQAQNSASMSHVSAHTHPTTFQHAVATPIPTHLQSSARMYSVEPLDDPMSPNWMQQPSPISGHPAVQHQTWLQMNGQLHHQQPYSAHPSGNMAQMTYEHGHSNAMGPNLAFYPAVPLFVSQHAAAMGFPAVGHSHPQSSQHLQMRSYQVAPGQDTAYQQQNTSHQLHAREYSTSSFQQNGPAPPGADPSSTWYQAPNSHSHPLVTQHQLYPQFQSLPSNAYMGPSSHPGLAGQMSFQTMGPANPSASSHTLRAAPLSRYGSPKDHSLGTPGMATAAAGAAPASDAISVKRERASSNASALLRSTTASARNDRNAAHLTNGSGSSPEEANKPSPDDERARTKGADKKVGDGLTTITIFQCRGFEGCNMTFSRSEHLARHVRKHTGERPFPCHCGKAFSRRDNLRRHAQTVHSDTPERNEAMMQELVVLHANIAASAAQMQHAHMQVSNKMVTAEEREAKEAGERRQGGQASSELASMDGGQASQLPMDTDTGSKKGRNGYSQYADATGATAPGPSIFPQEHSRQSFHPSGSIDTQNYVCCTCDKTFSRADTLQRHQLLHTDERPFRCPLEICEAAFRRVDRLSRHMKDVHKLQPDQVKELMERARDTTTAPRGPQLEPQSVLDMTSVGGTALQRPMGAGDDSNTGRNDYSQHADMTAAIAPSPSTPTQEYGNWSFTQPAVHSHGAPLRTSDPRLGHMPSTVGPNLRVPDPTALFTAPNSCYPAALIPGPSVSWTPSPASLGVPQHSVPEAPRVRRQTGAPALTEPGCKEKDKEKFQCSLGGCSKTFKRQVQLDRHISWHCGASFPRTDGLRQRIQQARSGPSGRGHAKLHSRSKGLARYQKAERRLFRCEHEGCTEVCLRRDLLYSHNKKKHGNIAPHTCPRPCPPCKAKWGFLRQIELDKHLQEKRCYPAQDLVLERNATKYQGAQALPPPDPTKAYPQVYEHFSVFSHAPYGGSVPHNQVISSGIAAPSAPAVDMFGYQVPSSHGPGGVAASTAPPGLQQQHSGYGEGSYHTSQLTAGPLRSATPAPGNAEISQVAGSVPHTGAEGAQKTYPHVTRDTSLKVSDASTSVAFPAQQPSSVQNVSTVGTASGPDARVKTPAGNLAPAVNSSTYPDGSGSGPAATDNLSNRRESKFSSMSSYNTFPGPGAGGWTSASTLRNGSFGDPLSTASDVGTAGTGHSAGHGATELPPHATQAPFDDYQPFILGGAGDGSDAHGTGTGFVREQAKSQSHGPAYQNGLLAAIQMRAPIEGTNPFSFGVERRPSRALTPEPPGSSRGRPVSASGRPASSRSRPASSRQNFGLAGAVVPFGRRPSSSAGLMGFLGPPPSGDFGLLESAGGNAPGVSDIPSIEEHLAATSESVSGSRQGRPSTPSVVRHAVQSSDGRSGSVLGGLGTRVRTVSKDFTASSIGPLGERRSSRPGFSIESIGRRPATGSSAFDSLKLLGGIGNLPPGSASGRTGSRESNAGGGLSIFSSAFSMERSRPSSSSGPMSSAGLASSTTGVNGTGQSARISGLAHRLNTTGSDLRTSAPMASPFMFQPPAAPQDHNPLPNTLPPLSGNRSTTSSSRRFLGSMGSLRSAPTTAETTANAVIPPLRLSGKRPADTEKVSGSTDTQDAERHAPRPRTKPPPELPASLKWIGSVKSLSPLFPCDESADGDTVRLRDHPRNWFAMTHMPPLIPCNTEDLRRQGQDVLRQRYRQFWDRREADAAGGTRKRVRNMPFAGTGAIYRSDYKRLKPTTAQKIQLQRLSSLYRTMYNRGIHVAKLIASKGRLAKDDPDHALYDSKLLPNDEATNLLQRIRDQLLSLDAWTYGHMDGWQKVWTTEDLLELRTVPSGIRDEACQEAASAALNAQKLPDAHLSYREPETGGAWFKLPKKNWKDGYLQAPYFGFCDPNTRPRQTQGALPEEQTKLCFSDGGGNRLRIHSDSAKIYARDRRWFIRYSVKIEQAEQNIPRRLPEPNEEETPRLCALDPGVRTMLTGYYPGSGDTSGGAFEIAPNACNRLFDMVKWVDTIDGFLAEAASGPKTRHEKRRLGVARRRKQQRIRQVVDQIHWEAIKYLQNNFDVVVLPKFAVARMVSKEGGRRICKTTAREMLALRHYRFRKRLEERMAVIYVFEDWTSKTCSQCGTVKHQLGGNKVHRCEECGRKADRDVNGARNIFFHWLHDVAHPEEAEDKRQRHYLNVDRAT